MKNISKKRKEWLEQYRKLRDIYTPVQCARCGIHGEWGALEPHHIAKRFNRWRTCLFLPLCGDCHEWCHHNSQKAKEDGWIINPRSKFDRDCLDAN